MKKLFTQYGGMKREIYILFFGKIVTAMGSFVWPMLTFLMTTKLGLSDSLSTLIIATATALGLPAALMGGKLADRFKRKYIIILFDLLTITSGVLAALLPIGYHTVALVFISGLFQTIEAPAYDALNSDYSTTEQREKAFSLSYLGYNLGFVFGASISGLLFNYSIPLTFLLNAASILVSTVLIIFFVHPENAVGEAAENEEAFGEYEQPVEENRSVLSVLWERKVVLFMIMIGCVAALPCNLVGILLPLQLKSDLGEFGATIYGYLNSVNGFVVILLTPLLTMALRRITEIPKIIIGMLFFVAGLALFSLNTAIWVLFAGMFVYTVGEVINVLGNNPYTSRRIPASHRGRVGGISSVVYSICSSAAQYAISGLLLATNNNYRMLWLIFICVGLLGVVLYALSYPADRRTFPGLYQKENR